MDHRGFTLVETLLGVFLLLGAGGALLVGMQQAMMSADYLRQLHAVVNAAQGRLEQLTATPFETLATGAEFASAWTVGRSEALTGLPEITDGRLSIQIRQPVDDDQLNNPGNPAVVTLHVAACWRFRGRLIAGDDKNCNGVLDADEAASGVDGLITSPVMLSTRMTKRS